MITKYFDSYFIKLIIRYKMKRSTKEKPEGKEGSQSGGTESPNSDTDSESSQRCQTNISQPPIQFQAESPENENEV